MSAANQEIFFLGGGGVWARETGAICQIGVLAWKRCIF